MRRYTFSSNGSRYTECSGAKSDSILSLKSRTSSYSSSEDEFSANMEELIAFFGKQRNQMTIFNDKVSKESEDFSLR